MKIALNYEPSTGQVTDDNGLMIVCYPGLSTHEITDSKPEAVESLVKLKDAGFYS